MHTRRTQRAKNRKGMQVERPKNIIIIDEEKDMSNELTLDELKENLANILAGIVAQNGFRKTFVENLVRKHVTDTAVADALVAELNKGLEGADEKFDVAVKAEAVEIDLPEADAEDLTKNLFE